MNQVMNFVAQSAEGQRVLSALLGSAPPGPAMAGGVGMPPGMSGAVPGLGVAEAPIFQAARQGEVAVVEQLLGSTRGTELSAQLSQAGDTLLHVAAWEGKSRLVRMLLARGHDVHALSRNKSTPLHYSAWNGHSESVKILLEAEADTERHMQGGDTALHQAAWNGHTEVARLLLNSGASMSATKEDGVCSVC